MAHQATKVKVVVKLDPKDVETLNSAVMIMCRSNNPADICHEERETYLRMMLRAAAEAVVSNRSRGELPLQMTIAGTPQPQPWRN